ncbi:hypothetical protein L2E82_11122 [Cichorium intybus]|uniref:Uncharacterized protein n=1 Tax=Cichorium intybus TaxID=13427 RepID=A0ACB9GDN2_CICIN|nr:hypothetical protein L2E82_11122 [Cichorium intybus]
MYQSAHRLLSALALPINPRSFPSSFVIVIKIKRSSEATTMMVLQRELKTTSDSLKYRQEGFKCVSSVFLIPTTKGNCDFSLQSMGTNSPKSSQQIIHNHFNQKELLLSIYHAGEESKNIFIRVLCCYRY